MKASGFSNRGKKEREQKKKKTTLKFYFGLYEKQCLLLMLNFLKVHKQPNVYLNEPEKNIVKENKSLTYSEVSAKNFPISIFFLNYFFSKVVLWYFVLC